MSDYRRAIGPHVVRARAKARSVAAHLQALAGDYPGHDLEEFRSVVLACAAAFSDFADQERPEPRGAHRRPAGEPPAPTLQRMRSNRGWQS